MTITTLQCVYTHLWTYQTDIGATHNHKITASAPCHSHVAYHYHSTLGFGAIGLHVVCSSWFRFVGLSRYIGVCSSPTCTRTDGQDRTSIDYIRPVHIPLQLPPSTAAVRQSRCPAFNVTLIAVVSMASCHSGGLKALSLSLYPWLALSLSQCLFQTLVVVFMQTIRPRHKQQQTVQLFSTR